MDNKLVWLICDNYKTAIHIYYETCTKLIEYKYLRTALSYISSQN